MNDKEFNLRRPINKNANIAKVENTDLSRLNSNIFQVFEEKTIKKFDRLNSEIFNFLKASPAFLDFFDKINKDYKNFEVVFPKGVLEKLKSGEYSIDKKKGLNEFVTFVRDSKTKKIVKQLRLKDISGSEKLNTILPTLQNMAVLQSLNKITKQLELIERKLIDIQKEFNNDRIGKIQGGYSSYLDALQMNNLENKKQALFASLQSIIEGRSQLIKAAESRLSKLEEHSPGFWNTLLNELTSVSTLSFTQTQKKSVKEFLNEIFYIQRSSQIILSIYEELDEPNSLSQSLAPYYNLMTFISDEKRVLLLNEWETSQIKWDELSTNIVKSIENIPDYKSNGISDYVLKIN